MTATATATGPVYLNEHGGHDRTDPRYAEVGYDVIRSTMRGGQTYLRVIATTAGAASYPEALRIAKAQRTGGAYGYPATRYACGCRWIATSLRPSGDNPAPV